MSLVELNNEYTDKNTLHSYLPLYNELLSNKKDTAKNILEVGIADGGSIKLWNDYFINATVYGLDIGTPERIMTDILNKDNILLFHSTDAYNEDVFREIILSKNIKFDMVLDDGPHTLESMIQFIKLYSQVLTDDGILIIEDVQNWDWIDNIQEVVPDHLKQYIKIYDLRANKNRYDDILFIIDKSAISIENV